MEHNTESSSEPIMLKQQETSNISPSKYEDLKLVSILLAVFYGTMILVLITTLLIRQFCNYIAKKQRFIPPRPYYLPSDTSFDETDALTIEPAKQCDDHGNSVI